MVNFVHLENLPAINFVSWRGDNRSACLCKNPRSQSKKTGSKLQITWDNPKELEVYIGKLQAAAEKLSTENRKLRKWHTDFIEKVLAETQYLNFWPLVQFFATTLPHSNWNKQQKSYYSLCSSPYLWVHFLGRDTDECWPTETSAAMEGWSSGASCWFCHSGGSGIDWRCLGWNVSQMFCLIGFLFCA